MKKHPGCLGGYPYPLLEGLYPITPWDPYMIYIYLHLSHKSSAKYTSSMDPSWVIGILESLFSTASSTWKPCCPPVVLACSSPKKRGFPTLWRVETPCCLNGAELNVTGNVSSDEQKHPQQN